MYKKKENEYLEWIFGLPTYPPTHLLRLATRLHGPEMESRWLRDFCICPDRPRGPTSLLYNGYRGFFGGKEQPGREADPSLPSSAVVKKEKSYTSTPLMGRTACTEPQCLYSRAIPLLPLWAVLPVQSLSACTVELYLYSPYGPYGLYRASVPVQ